MRVTKQDVSVSVTYQGALELSAIVVKGSEAYLEHAQYFGYPKGKAIQLFLERCNPKEEA
jgi:hypothetical protein